MATRDKLIRPEADVDVRHPAAAHAHEEEDDKDDPRTQRRPAQVWARHEAAARSPTVTPTDDANAAEQLIDAARTDAETILGTLIPAYVEARDHLNPALVAKLGADMIARFARMHSAKRRVDEVAKP